MRKRYKSSEYLVCDSRDVTQLAFLQLSQQEEKRLREIIDILAEYGWSYGEEVREDGYPCVVSSMLKIVVGQERRVPLDVRSSLLLYDLGSLLTLIDQAENPQSDGGLKGLELLLRQRQRETELVADYEARQRKYVGG